MFAVVQHPSSKATASHAGARKRCSWEPQRPQFGVDRAILETVNYRADICVLHVAVREITGPTIAGFSVTGFVDNVSDGETWFRIAVSRNQDITLPAVLFAEHNYFEYARLRSYLGYGSNGPIQAAGYGAELPKCPIEKAVLDIFRAARKTFPQNIAVRRLIRQMLTTLRLPIDNGARLSLMLPAVSTHRQGRAYVPADPLKLACIAIVKTALSLIAGQHPDAVVKTLEFYLDQLSQPLGFIHFAKSPKGEILWT